MILVVVFIEIKLRTMFTLNIFGKHGGRVTSFIEPDYILSAVECKHCSLYNIICYNKIIYTVNYIGNVRE